MDIYIARIENGQIFALEIYAGVTYQQGMAIVATIPIIKVMCDAVGYTYDSFDQLTDYNE